MGTFGEIEYDIVIGANQAIRRNAADTAWEVFTPSAGGGGVWGAITGTLSSQTDLQAALDAKQASGNYATGGGTATGTNTGDNATNSQYSGLAASKQDTLVSGTNIKTINGSSLLGSGDIAISGSGLAQYQVRQLIRR